MSAADIKRSVKAGDVFDVTNHYITRPDHLCFGTHRRRVIRANAGAFTLTNGPEALLDVAGTLDLDESHQGSRIPWPKASEIQQDPDGTIRIYGHPKPGALFLTLRPVRLDVRYPDNSEPEGACLSDPDGMHYVGCGCP